MNRFNCTNNRILRDITEFHEKFGLTYDGVPRNLRTAQYIDGKRLQKFRRDFITEEFLEFLRAEAREEAKDEIDACVDMVYVILGYCYLRGWDFDEAWKRVHRANMTKVRVLDSRGRSPWDVIKPDGFIPPDHSDLV